MDCTFALMGRLIKGRLLFIVSAQIWEHLSPKLRLKAIALLVAQVAGSLLEVLSIAAIVPVIITLARPGMAGSSEVINALHHFFGSPATEDFMLYLLLGLVSFFALKTLFQIYVTHLGSRFAFKISLELAENQARHYLNSSYNQIKRENTYRMLNNSMQVPTQTAHGIILPILLLLSEALVALLILVAILLFKPLILLALMVTIGPVLLIAFLAVKQKVAKIGDVTNELSPISAGWIHNAYKGFIDLKLHGKQGFFTKKFTDNLDRIYQLQALKYTYGIIPQKVTEFAAIFAILIIFGFTRITGGSSEQLVVFLSLFAAAAYRLLPSFSRIFGAMMIVKQHQHVINILKPKTDLEAGEAGEVQFEKSLQLKNVTYSFPDAGKGVLNGVSATINRGDVIGIFGPSGSGKSTLMYMILGFYYPDAGEILIDGEQLQQKNIPAWQSKVALVKQDIFLLTGSIKDNIAFGADDVDVQRLQNSLQLAGLKEAIGQLPEGPETKIGEDGLRLSTGQRQRLGIARALYHNAELLVFDEATNAIDMQTEQEIIGELDKLCNAGKTIILIAHRHTTLKKCNRIFTMNKGQIIAETTYMELTDELRQKEMI